MTPQRADNSFQVWFQVDDRLVIVRGEGHGTAASVTLEHTDGLELVEIYLVPVEFRPKPWKKTKRAPDQLEQVQAAARRMQAHAVDFLGGDLTRFRALAQPLPPYRRQLS